MRFVFITERGKLNALANRIVSENHEVFVNQAGAEGPLVITDRPLNQYRNYSFCLGYSELASALGDRSYCEALLLARDIPIARVEPNAYVSCWFNGIDFVYPAVLAVNEDTFMEAGLGKKVDSMGCALTTIHSNCKIFKQLLIPMKPILRKFNYTGMITFACAFQEDSFKVHKIYPYFIVDLLYAFLELVQEEIGRALHGVATGEKREFKCSDAYAISVKLSIPPYPYNIIKSEKLKLIGYCPENGRHIWLRNAVEEHGLVSSIEANGEIASITARGSSVQECRRRAYRTIRNLSIDEMQYRRDVGVTAKDLFEDIRQQGWI